jgi:hypothetical protein
MTGDIQRSYRLQTPLARLFGCIRAHRNIAVATPLGREYRARRFPLAQQALTPGA